MDIILCHTTADFDTLGAAVGCAALQPGSRIVLAGGCHPAVRDFLALHRDEYPLIERRSVNPLHLRSLTIVDAQRRDRLGKTAEWLDLPQVKLRVYDHHVHIESDFGVVHETTIEAVGATTTLIAEQLQTEGVALNPFSATVMALGIHVDTGSLTFDHTTPRDALALAWLMQQGANISVIAQYIDPGLSPPLQVLLQDALSQLETFDIQGYQVSRIWLDTDVFVPISGLK
jgi:tRNA nucleotidyltransferase (CCA-adding enzyme)